MLLHKPVCLNAMEDFYDILGVSTWKQVAVFQSTVLPEHLPGITNKTNGNSYACFVSAEARTAHLLVSSFSFQEHIVNVELKTNSQRDLRLPHFVALSTGM